MYVSINTRLSLTRCSLTPAGRNKPNLADAARTKRELILAQTTSACYLRPHAFPPSTRAFSACGQYHTLSSAARHEAIGAGQPDSALTQAAVDRTVPESGLPRDLVPPASASALSAQAASSSHAIPHYLPPEQAFVASPFPQPPGHPSQLTRGRI